MFGNDYFQTRQRLKDVVVGVLNLTEKTGADNALLLDADISKGLNDPFLFTAYGEKKTGRSMFLNALLGSELCHVDTAKSGESVNWYFYGKKKSEKSTEPILKYEVRDELFLQKFNIVDAPGTNSSVAESKLVVQGMLPISDIIFWVFSVENPWAAATWEALSKQSPEILDNSVIILQQVDLRQPEDIEVMLGHMNDLAMQRIGRTLPVFPVSAKMAYAAKLEKSPDRRILENSGFAALEHSISERINRSPSRKAVLGQVRDATVSVLHDVEAMIERRRKLLDENEGFLRDIEFEVEGEREDHAAQFKGNLVSMRNVFKDQTADAVRFMRVKMNVTGSLKSIFVTGHFSKGIEAGLIDLIKAAVEKQVDKEGERLVSDCRAHWETVRPRVEEQLTIELGDFDKVSGGFASTRKKFTARMGAAALDSVVNLRIRSGLDRQLTERLQSLKSSLYIVLGCITGAGLTGFFQWGSYPYLSLIFLLAALVAIVAFTVKSNRSRRDILKSFAERLEDSRIPFADGLNSDYKEGVHDFYIAYGNLLGGVRTHIVKAKQELQPNLEQWNALFLELKGIEQEF